MNTEVNESQYYLNRLLDLAQSHLAVRRPELARDLCYRVLELHPGNLEASYLLAKIAAEEKDYTVAADLIASLKTWICDDTFLQNYYEWHRESQKLDQAVIFLRGCVLNSSSSYAAWYCLASACLDLSDIPGFQQAARRAGRLRPTVGSSNYDLALLY